MFKNAEVFSQNLCRWNISPNASTLDFCGIGSYCGGSCSPASAPSPNRNCYMDDVLGQTFFIPGQGACWRVQLGSGGTLEADFGDPSCSKTESIWQSTNGIFSLYDSFDQANNAAVFSPGPNRYSGTFQFKEDPVLTQASLDLLSWDRKNKVFELLVTIPTCNLSC